ncbi:MAG: exodeoxyribonuclease VII large subunit [Candidatus Methanoperedens sp.]|nr:exodeoxyribonuclease VII large subunit [Candidatus Methanoperedens sp.]MCE8424651.1 exodeoxyribonuclease VII large subunit [Candidatus Methanoperedens sp.]MCE8426902.1 exodeoxyribonuclease VII large subunit [Candidatus Methanoperedens sp.]
MFYDEKSVYTVHELTLAIKNVLTDGKFSDVWIRGEISNFTNHNSGHRYFTLKDKNSSLQCVMFKWHGQKLRFELEHGMKVLVLGDIDLYELRGQYQLKVREIKTDGIGELYKAYELLKNKLAMEGLFSQQRKRKLPGFPKKIGVATSPTGAVLHDILTVLKRRFPVDILFISTIVQGESAATSIVNSIEALNSTNVDLIILGRGGGSIEDLWPFNEEIVARAVFNSRIPVISAVGHETDFTISDFVADVRAPTPSAAAEIAVPDRKEIYNRIMRLNDRLTDAQKHYLYDRQTRLIDLKKCTDPRLLIERLGDLIQYLDEMAQRQNLSIKRRIEAKKALFDTQAGKLDAVSPLGTLLRGYSIALKMPGMDIISSINCIEEKDNIQIIVNDGRINCEVNEKEVFNGNDL